MTVEMLSRFRSAKEQAKIVDDLSEGQVDIVIGTHRLLSKDIEFKDLGLVMVDEEFRINSEGEFSVVADPAAGGGYGLIDNL